MSRFRIALLTIRGEFAEAMQEIERPIAEATTAAMRDVAEQLKSSGRANMAAAGFSRRWQNAFRSDYFPKGGKKSVEAAAIGYHKAGYAGVFEEGPTKIAGKPLLWMPLGTTPKRIGQKRLTPQEYVRSVGPLFTINRPGLPPLLAGQIAINRRGQRNRSKVTLTALRRGGKGAASRLQPLFVGIPQVNIPDKFEIKEVAQRIAGRLPELYFKHLRVT